MAAALPPGWPAPPAHLHFLGICGYSVSGLALLCRGLGYRVTGSDEDAYPPTTLILTEAGVDFADRHRAENLGRWGEPALVVLGNQVQRSNPELVAAQELALLLISEAEAYGALTGTRRRAVICGSHGKTTTSTLAALMLDRAGFGAGFRLGATALDFGQSARLGDPADGSPFVFEGDEYTTSALDPR
ncbi:MAG: Mur ligase domain-containing protein, partial [Candidatus Dormibacteria bacterium]